MDGGEVGVVLGTQGVFWRPFRVKKEKTSPHFPMHVVDTVLVLRCRQVGRQQKWVRLGDHLPLPMPKTKTGVE